MTEVLAGRLLRWAGSPFETPDALRWESHGAVAISDGCIVAAGPEDSVRARHPDARLTRTPHLIAPGFVDAHVHYPQIGIVASWGADLIDWLDRFTFPEESRFADPAHAASAASAYFDEQLRNGITTAASFCTSHPASAEAYFAEADRRGLRAIGGKVMMDRHAPAALCDTPGRGYDETAALIARWHGRGRASVAITPRFAPTSTPEQLEAAGALWAAHPDCLMQTHLSEQTREIAWVADLFPGHADYLSVYEAFGLIGARAIYGHAIHLTDRERARLAEAGAAVAHCPTSNQFLGSGECPVAALVASGVATGLATDTGGGTSYAMFDTMKAAYEVARRRGDTLTPTQLWWLATAGAAEALHLGGTVGALAPGEDADLIEIDTAATPLLAARSARAETPEDLLFALAILADDRAIARTVSGGRTVWARG